jgi:hypothetical protein
LGLRRQVKIATKFMIEDDEPEVDSIIQQMLFRSLADFYEVQINYNQFTSDEEAEDKFVGYFKLSKSGPNNC